MKAVNRTRLLFAVYDLSLVAFSMLVVAWIHDGSPIFHKGISYLFAFIFFPLLWTILSLVTRKFRIGERNNQQAVFVSVIFSNFIIVSITTIIMVLFQLTFYSRFIFFGTVAMITAVELFTGLIYVSVQNSVFLKDWIGLEIPGEQAQDLEPVTHRAGLQVPGNFETLRDSITEEAGEEAFRWIDSQVDITDPQNLVLATGLRFNLINHPRKMFNSIVNLHRINNHQRINKFFETVNAKLPLHGVYIGCVETYPLRKQYILSRFPPVISHLLYLFDFMVHRVFSKVALTRKIYFFITRGKRRVLSRAETIGRLYSCGFELLEERTIGGLLWWTTRKIREPYFDTNPTYGIFIRLRRIGKGGEEFNVFKLRTMHAYAEYIQHYVYEKHQLDEGGKFRNDFRVTTLGRIMRKLWIDELPMLLNVLMGEMKIVGVRPLSRHYFNLYSEEARNLRIRVKPGLIPPFYAQHPTPSTLEEVQQNEMTYLRAYLRHPFLTDVKYFFLAVFHIFWKRSRSK